MIVIDLVVQVLSLVKFKKSRQTLNLTRTAASCQLKESFAISGIIKLVTEDSGGFSTFKLRSIR